MNGKSTYLRPKNTSASRGYLGKRLRGRRPDNLIEPTLQQKIADRNKAYKYVFSEHYETVDDLVQNCKLFFSKFIVGKSLAVDSKSIQEDVNFINREWATST